MSSRHRAQIPYPFQAGRCCATALRSLPDQLDSADQPTDAATVPLDSLYSNPFLQDMHRVLDSRRDAIDNDPVLSDGMMERRTKPPLIVNDIDGAERCLVLLRHLQRHHSNLLVQSTNNMTLAEAAYQIVMRAFLKRGRLRWHNTTTIASTTASTTIICAADQLPELLSELQGLLGASSLSLETYNLVLEAYALCATPRGDRIYASRAQALLHTLQHQAVSKDVSSPVPSVESYLHVLHAYAWQQANLHPPDTGAEHAFGLLDTICNLEPNQNILMQAHIWVLEAYSKSIGGARRCQQLLDMVKVLNATTINEGATCSSVLLDAEVYSNAILAWSKATEEMDVGLESSIPPAEMAHSLLLELIDLYLAGAFRTIEGIGSEPPLIAFNGVISAWGRVGRVDKSEEVLWLMEKKLRPLCSNLVPNAVSYNSVLHGILRIQNRETALIKALDLVSYMERHAKEQPAIQPNAFTYQTLIKCWLQSPRPNAAEESERLLTRVEQLWSAGDDSILPTNRIYNMVLNVHAKTSSGRVVATKALDLIRRMKSTSKCQPDIISYTSAIECISNSGDVKAPELAEELFLEATKRYNDTKLPTLLPNLRFYTMTIQALAKNNGSPVRARALLTQLIEQYHASGQNPQLLPNTYPYNYVLNCAANTLNTDKMEAFRIASQTYQEMRKSDLVRPDSYSFAFWLKCCNNLLEPGDLRTKGVSFAFEECKREGLVNNEVITRLVQGSPVSLVDQLLETDVPDKDRKVLARETSLPSKGLSIRATPSNSNVRTLTIRDLPPSWSRNTRQR